MSNPAFLEIVQQAIVEATAEDFVLRQAVSTGGGCINSTYRLEGNGRAYFVKLNRKELLPMFEAEAMGLHEIAETGTVRAPMPICFGVAGDNSYLVMENLSLRSGVGDCNRLLGQRLAAMHRISKPYYGWHIDNTIGSTPQINARGDGWVEFWAEKRLGFQLQLAKNQGYGGRLQSQGEKLRERLVEFFTDYKPKPSLLHGDLWGGNYSADETGQPVIYDPACYYGDREADIAMTELFGGFGKDFYAAYGESFPLEHGYSVRKNLYNLYHILNHLNLFGGGYLAQAESMLARLLAEIG